MVPDVINVLRPTMEGLTQALKVRHIASSPLVTCLEEDVPNVASGAKWPEYSQVPVRNSAGHVVEVIERGRSGGGSKRRIDDSLLVAADTPLQDYIASASKEPSYRLVVGPEGIDGIVTTGDLQKLPVRLLVFTLVTHLEMLMAEIIRTRVPDDEAWMVCLGSGARARIEKVFSERRGRNEEVDRVECSSLADKATAVWGLLTWPETRLIQLKQINDIRNAACHARRFSRTTGQLGAFIGPGGLVMRYIRLLEEELRPEHMRE